MTSTSVGMRCPECARDRTKVHRAPAGFSTGALGPVTTALIVLNVVVFVAEIATGASLFSGRGSTVYSEGALIPILVGDGEIYRLVTSGFLHSGLPHLALNMFALYFLGSLLENGVGARAYLGIYIVSLLGGSLGVILLEPNVGAAGASGAVFGLLAAAFLIARERGLDHIASQIGFFVVLNLFFTFSVPGISIGGHLGGLAAGALCAFVLRGVRTVSGPSRQFAEIGAFVALAVITIALSIALAPEPQTLLLPQGRG